MKSDKYLWLILLFFAMSGLSLKLVHAATTSATASATVAVRGVFAIPACTIKVPASVSLGFLNVGRTEHTGSSFDISVSCPVELDVAIYADNKTGVLDSTGRKMTMISSSNSGSNRGTPALFSLKNNTTIIKLDGTGAGDLNNTFCRGETGTATRSCTLTPVTEVFGDTPAEEIMAVVGFNIMFP